MTKYQRKLAEVESRMEQCKTPGCSARGRCAGCSSAYWEALNAAERIGWYISRSGQEFRPKRIDAERRAEQSAIDERRYLALEAWNDVAARHCRFCKTSLAEDPYDLIEWPTESSAVPGFGDCEDLVCADCYHKHGGAARDAAFKKFHGMTSGILQ